MESLTRGARTSCGARPFSFWLRQTQRGESWEHRRPPSPSRACSRLLVLPHVPPATDTWWWDGAGILGAGGEVAAGLGHEPCWWSRVPPCHQLSAPPEGPGGRQPSESYLRCLGTPRQGDIM